MMLSTFTHSALVVLVAALFFTTTSAESIGLRNFIDEQPSAVGTTCTSDADCGPSQWDYCEFPIGSCGEDGQPGECARATPACTRQYRPVCKCDGNTAATKCTAGTVNIRSLGECPEPEPEDRSVNGECLSNEGCGSEEFCKKADGDCDGVGKCHKTPFGSNRSYLPGCGCDGYFYANRSVANTERTNIDSRASSPDDCPKGSRNSIDTAIE